MLFLVKQRICPGCGLRRLEGRVYSDGQVTRAPHGRRHVRTGRNMAEVQVLLGSEDGQNDKSLEVI